jgi:pimeloyl-ACP methyl ester carboxylesterase
VVLLHGGASDSRDWLSTMSALAPAFTLYAPDMPGFGRSYRKQSGYHLSDFFEFAEEFISTLGMEDPAIVGHSFGGRVAVGVAARANAKVRRLVLVDASGVGKISPFGSVLFYFFWALRAALRRPQPFPRFLAGDGEDYNYAGDAALRNLKATTLLVWKGFDPYMPLSLARRAVKMIPGARLVVLPGYGHAPHGKDSDAFNKLLLEFLASPR